MEERREGRTLHCRVSAVWLGTKRLRATNLSSVALSSSISSLLFLLLRPPEASSVARAADVCRSSASKADRTSSRTLSSRSLKRAINVGAAPL